MAKFRVDGRRQSGAFQTNWDISQRTVPLLDLYRRFTRWRFNRSSTNKLLNGKTAYQGGGLIADVKPEHRLSPSNPNIQSEFTGGRRRPFQHRNFDKAMAC